MPTAILTHQWPVASNGGWAETFNFWSGSVGTADSLAGCTAVINMLRPGRPASEALSFASTDTPAYVTVSANQVLIDIPRSVTFGWTPGAYDFQLRVVGAADYDLYNLVGPGRVVVIEAPGT